MELLYDGTRNSTLGIRDPGSGIRDPALGAGGWALGARRSALEADGQACLEVSDGRTRRIVATPTPRIIPAQSRPTSVAWCTVVRIIAASGTAGPAAASLSACW